jgi:hypothetical protein
MQTGVGAKGEAILEALLARSTKKQFMTDFISKRNITLETTITFQPCKNDIQDFLILSKFI